MTFVFGSDNLIPLLGVLFLSFILNLIIIYCSKRFFLNSTEAADLLATQATHVTPTPRLGGLGIVGALWLGVFVLVGQIDFNLAIILIVSTLPVLCAGIFEDVTRKVSPKKRLLAAFLSAILAVILSSVTIKNAGLWPFDYLLSFTLISVAFTIFLSASMCHAINLMDGLNGLTGAYGIATCIGLSSISYFVSDLDLHLISLVFASAVLGFFVLNWPMGRIFLGDGGAYTMGHILAWIAVLLSARNPEISGISLFLMFFWPLADTMLAIVRRKITGTDTYQPDRMHFHHMALNILSLKGPKNISKTMRNSLASLMILPFVFSPIIAGVVFWNDAKASLICLGIFSILFIVSYMTGRQLCQTQVMPPSAAHKHS